MWPIVALVSHNCLMLSQHSENISVEFFRREIKIGLFWIMTFGIHSAHEAFSSTFLSHSDTATKQMGSFWNERKKKTDPWELEEHKTTKPQQHSESWESCNLPRLVKSKDSPLRKPPVLSSASPKWEIAPLQPQTQTSARSPSQEGAWGAQGLFSELQDPPGNLPHFHLFISLVAEEAA